MIRRFIGCALAALVPFLATNLDAQASSSAFTTGMRYNLDREIVGIIEPDPDGSGPLQFKAVRNTYDDSGRLVMIETGQLANWQSQDVAPANWQNFTVYSTTAVSYDINGRRLSTIASAAGTSYTATQYSYETAGRLQCTAVRMNPASFASLPPDGCTLGAQGNDGPDRITRNAYDAAGQLAKVQKAYGTSLQIDEATYTYTANGKRRTVQDANGNLATLTYDGYDRLAAWYFPNVTSAGNSSDSDYEAYGYDADSNRTSLRKRDGRTITYNYDALNRMISKVVPGGCAPIQVGGCTPGWAARDIYYGYDLRGLQIFARFDSASGDGVTTTYDGFGEMVSSTTSMGGYSRTLTSTYDANGNRVRLTHPDGVFVNYYQDGLDRLYYADLNGNAPLFYPPYDEVGRNPVLYRWSSSSSNWVANTTYQFDGIDRPVRQAQNFTNGANNVTSTLGYNAASQLTSLGLSNDAYAWTGAVNVDRGYGVNGLNQYTSAGSATFSYDANGNLIGDGTRSYVYDAENRLVTTGDGTTLTYDPLGRLWQTSGSQTGTTQFLYDGDRLTAEYDGSGAMLKRYVHGPGDDSPLVQYDGSGTSSPRFLFADHQGSVVGIADANGNLINIDSYDEYGIPGAANTGRFQYTSQTWLPELGMYYFKARIYSPTLGRFLQTDPIGYDDQINLYAYVANDPVNGTDPTGNACEKPDSGPCPNADDHTFRDRMAAAGAAAGAIVGGVAGGTAGGTGGAVAGAACGPGAVACSPAGAAAGATAGAAAGAAGGAVAGGVVGGLIGAAIDKGIVLFNKATGDASTPTGSRGSPIDVKPGTNAPTRIGGREYSGHSLDRMQGRGVTPSVVENAIQNGTRSAGNAPGTFVHAGDGVTVITNSAGRVITVIAK